MNNTRILFIGAHPDDPDILFGGTALQLAKNGAVIKFVSVTNGDTGHQTLSRKETAIRRKAETQASARLAGLEEYEVLNHDCGLEPTVENRRELIRIIRRFQPDLVISHRLCDYHPDHRATAQLVQDTAFQVMVPHFCEDTPVPERVPVYAFSYDAFKEPRPFRPDAAIEFDSVLKEKLALFNCHSSQFYEWLPWVRGMKDFDVSRLNEEEKLAHLEIWCSRFTGAADSARELLIRVYGKAAGEKIRYAETFELSPYGRQISADELQKMLMSKI